MERFLQLKFNPDNPRDRFLIDWLTDYPGNKSELLRQLLFSAIRRGEIVVTIDLSGIQVEQG